MAQEVEARSYRNRAVAEGIAERFEVFVVEAKLQVRPNTGIIATRLVQADDGSNPVGKVGIEADMYQAGFPLYA